MYISSIPAALTPKPQKMDAKVCTCIHIYVHVCVYIYVCIFNHPHLLPARQNQEKFV